MDAKDKMATIKPFEVTVSGVRLKTWRNPYTRTASVEKIGHADANGERAVEIAFAWLSMRVRRFLGSGWKVIKGEGW